MTQATATETITIVRELNAPRESVWKAWTDADMMMRWWGPKDWTLPVCEMDFRVGGSWFYCMAGPTGEQSCGRSTYEEIVVPERIVYRDEFAERDGSIIEGMPEMRITVEFAE